MTKPRNESQARLRVAIQKSGRLSERSIALFSKCGLDFDFRKDRLLQSCNDFPIELMLVRDDDIPEYVVDGVCDLGIVGENVIEEKYLSLPHVEASAGESNAIEVILKLGFGGCRLALAAPDDFKFESVRSLDGLRIATSYPNCLNRYLRANNLKAQIVELSGSVEIAPALKIADLVCDLVSSGATLQSNGLRELTTLYKSQACLVRTGRAIGAEKQILLQRLLQRIEGVLQASRSKYIMMNAPLSALGAIQRIIPGMEEPSVIPLGTDGKRVALHAVAREDVFWDTIESLKAVGASSILVLPIEKVIA